MKFLAIIAALLIGISTVSGVKKCRTYLPHSNPTGVEVTGTTVVFPTTTKDPSAKSKISTEFNSKGLSAFFNLARSFMNTVQNKPLPPLKGKKSISIATQFSFATIASTSLLSKCFCSRGVVSCRDEV